MHFRSADRPDRAGERLGLGTGACNARRSSGSPTSLPASVWIALSRWLTGDPLAEEPNHRSRAFDSDTESSMKFKMHGSVGTSSFQLALISVCLSSSLHMPTCSQQGCVSWSLGWWANHAYACTWQFPNARHAFFLYISRVMHHI
jgi:hypothetical protein